MLGLFRSSDLRSDPDASTGHHETVDEVALEAALDTLASVLRTFGKHSFDLEDLSAPQIAARCDEWARHVLLGTPMHDHQPVDPGADAGRAWAIVRKRFSEIRLRERKHVSRSMDGLRTALWSFVGTLKRSFEEDASTDRGLLEQLDRLRAAAGQADPDKLRAVSLEVSQRVEDALEHRRTRHDGILRDLGEHLRHVRGALKQARRNAATDPLTGLPNRGSLDERLRQGVTLGVYAGQPECLLLIDLDRFKDVNDTHGHRAGDLVLQAVAEVLCRVVVRRADFVARFGGEEFAVVLDDSDEHDGARLADRIRREIAELEVDHHGVALKVTASVGVAGVRRTDDEERWLEAADAALYRAKEEGRDRVCVRE